MTQSSREREKSAEKLWDLSPVGERTKCRTKDGQDPETEFDAVEELYVENVLGAETVNAEEVDEVSGREVKVDVLEH